MSNASLDVRTTLARPDLADQALEGRVQAARFAPTRPMHAASGVADIRTAPEPGSARVDQLLAGEVFDVLERRGDHLWGQARRDGVVGWVSGADLADGAPRPTHMIARPDGPLPLNALTRDDVAARAIGRFATDLAAVAESLLGTPHEIGARSSRSTDCAGLVQQCLYACGRSGPRYADQQAALGHAVAGDAARRGDLVIWMHPTGGQGWSGHSAVMTDEDTIIHAVGALGCVVREPLVDADRRCRAEGFSRKVFRRLA